LDFGCFGLPCKNWPSQCCQQAVPKVIYRTNQTRRGFITAMLAPVNDKHEPIFGVRQVIWTVILAFATVAQARFLLI
jgi:hypothetical protein